MTYPTYTPETCPLCRYDELEFGDYLYRYSSWDGGIEFEYVRPVRFCPLCGRKLPEEDESEERPRNAVRTILNNHVNLCDSCKHLYPECDASTDDIAFGDGKGNDNICLCSEYVPVVVRGNEYYETVRKNNGE